MKFDLLSFIYCSISLTVGSIIRRSDAASSSSSLYLRRNTDSSGNTIVNINDNNNMNLNDRILQIDQVIRTDLVRLIPFDVQIAIEDDSSSSTGGDDLVSETLYKNGGSLLTDIITDWMMESFETKTSNQNQNNYNINNKQNQLVNNNTSFDSIALELIDETNSIGLINGQELNLVQVSFEGVSLWERIGTGTPPMEPEIVELIQRATFLEDKKLKEDLQSVVSNLLIDLGIDTEEDQQPSITIVDVRAYITPPSANSNSNSNTDGNSNSSNNNNGEQPSSTDGNNSNNSNSSSNENLEIIIIVAIVVACLAFVLLMFAVVWAWRSDRRDYDEKQSLASQGAGAGSLQQPKSSSSVSKKQLQQQRKSKRSSSNKSATSNSSSNNNKSKKKGMMNRKSNATQKRSVGHRNSRENDNAAAAGGGIDTSGAANFPDILNKGSYPKEIGDTNNGYENNGQGGSNQYPDSVISEDISTSLSAYYKSGMAYNAVGAPKHLSNGGDINDAASMSSMDSYGYSLDGYAPSLGPAQGGYPVGPLQAAKDLPVPVGDSSDTMDIVQLQQEVEEPEDYDAETPIKAAADADVDDNEA